MANKNGSTSIHLRLNIGPMAFAFLVHTTPIKNIDEQSTNSSNRSTFTTFWCVTNMDQNNEHIYKN